MFIKRTDSFINTGVFDNPTQRNIKRQPELQTDVPLDDLYFGNDKKLNQPKFVRKPTHIQYSEDFSKTEVEEKFDTFYYNYEDQEDDQIFDEKYHINIEWLTVSNTKIEFDYIYSTSKIQLTAKSEMKSKYCVFIPNDISKTECAIEVFANSKAHFQKCLFKQGVRTAVIVRDYSTAVFEHCLFEENNIAVFIMNGAKAIFNDCKFKTSKNITIFVTKESQCEINNCQFYNSESKAIFAKDSSVVKLKNTLFTKVMKGAVTIAEKSKLLIDGNVKIEKSKNTAIRAIKNSEIKAHDLLIDNTDGNAINIDDSTGYFINCKFSDTIHPTIAVLGRNSNPIFHDCIIEKNRDTFCVITKNGSRPLFHQCRFHNCETNCFSISDFSQPHVQNCCFNDIKKYYMNIFGGSHLTFYDIKTEDKGINLEEKIHLLKSAECEYKSLQDIIAEEEKERKEEEEEKKKNDANTNTNTNNNRASCRSWVSPTYKIPEKVTDLEEPQILKEGLLKHLKVLNDEKLIKKTEELDISLLCCHCNKLMSEDDEPNILTPCGHLVCKDCSSLIKKCPICDSPIKKAQRIYFEDECALCLDHKPNTISLPCGHMCMCYDCAMKNASNNFNCPICNEPLSGYKFVFDDNSPKEINIKQIKTHQNKIKMEQINPPLQIKTQIEIVPDKNMIQQIQTMKSSIINHSYDDFGPVFAKPAPFV